MAKRKLKEKIIELRSLGYAYNKIAAELDCDKGTIAYHCGPGQKEKHHQRQRKNRKISVLTIICHKLDSFISRNGKTTIQEIKSHDNIIKRICIKLNKFCKGKNDMPQIKSQDVLNKIGSEPKCYLTGRPIDLTKSITYQFDHKIPASRGGSNDIDNLGLTCRQANQAKYDMTIDEFLQLCQDVLKHNGYEVIKKQSVQS